MLLWIVDSMFIFIPAVFYLGILSPLKQQIMHVLSVILIYFFLSFASQEAHGKFLRLKKLTGIFCVTPAVGCPDPRT